MVRSMRLSLEAVDRRLEDAAGTLGADAFWVFATITLPLILPGIAAGMILSFARALGEFGATITFVSNIPGETQTLPTAIYTFLQVPGGDLAAFRLTLVSIAISLARAVRLRGADRAGDPPRSRALTCSRSTVEHHFGSFRLDAAFDSAGGLTALFGRSGAGKTSLINAIAGLLRPERGRITLDGEVLTDTERGIFVPARRRRIGYVFQEGRLFPHLSVRQNLLYGRWFAPKGGRAGEVDQIVELLGIAALLDRRPANLSGGEKQRVAIGRALLGAPAPSRHGRAAGVARRGAQGRDPALYRAPARRGWRADRLCQPPNRRGGPARHRSGHPLRGSRSPRSDRPQRSWGGSTCSR